MPKPPPPAARAPGERRAANPDLSLLTTPAFSRHFIPFRRGDLLAMCLKDSPLPTDQQAQVALLAELLGEFYHREFHRSYERLNQAYAPFSPERQTKLPIGVAGAADPRVFLNQLSFVLERANFERLPYKELRAALRQAAPHNFEMAVDFEEFAEVLLFYRGITKPPVPLPATWNEPEETGASYDRVMICIRYKDSHAKAGGRVLLKLFNDVPRTQLHVLFPNATIRLRAAEKAGLASAAILALGAAVALGKQLIASSAAQAPQLATTAGESTTSVGLVATVAGLMALLGWRFWSILARRRAFNHAAAESLYFNLLENNGGVFQRLISDAEDEEVKETLLTYHALLVAGEPVTVAALDQQLKHWFAYKWHSHVEFDIDDALQKLLRLGLIRRKGEYWLPKPLAEVLQIVRSQIYADFG